MMMYKDLKDPCEISGSSFNNNIDKTSYEEESSNEDTEFSSNYDITQYFPRGDTGSIIITTRLQLLVSLGSQVHLRKLDVHDGLLILERHVGRSLKRTGSHTASTNNPGMDEWDLGLCFPIFFKNEIYTTFTS